jgi:hypothetical protein
MCYQSCYGVQDVEEYTTKAALAVGVSTPGGPWTDE